MRAERTYSLSGRSLFIALPAYDFKVSLRLAVSLARFAQSAPQHGIDVHIGSVCGCSVVSRARNLLVSDFLASEATELLFIDSDINFEPEAVLRLMAWGADVKKGIVAAVPRVRDTAEVYIADLDYDTDNQLTMDGMGLVRARNVATAFMWVARGALEELVEDHPEWVYYDPRAKRNLSAVFDFEVRPDGYVGEDFLFCERVRAAGYEVWVDPSITLGHMGVQEYVGNFGDSVLYPMITPPVDEEVAQ
jgi:hypothetical protein